MVFSWSEKVGLFRCLFLYGFHQLCMSVKFQNSFIDMFRNDRTITDIYFESKFESEQTAIPFMSSKCIIG